MSLTNSTDTYKLPSTTAYDDNRMSARPSRARAHCAGVPDGHHRVEQDDKDDPLRKVVEAGEDGQLEVPHVQAQVGVLWGAGGRVGVHGGDG